MIKSREGEKELKYFKCVRIELLNSFAQSAPFFLHLIKSIENIRDSQFISPVSLFRSEKETFYFLKQKITYDAVEDIDLHANSPKFIFVTCNFVQHSSVH